jgi:hypothetical protein
MRTFGLPAEPVPRDPAASEAAHELSKKIYRDQRPSLLSQAVDWVTEHIRDLFDRATNAGPGGSFGLLVFVVAVLALVGFLIWRFGLPGRSSRVQRTADTVMPTRSAIEHQAQADAFAAEGRWAEAVRERLRGVVAGLVARGLVDNRPGRTASEIAAEASRALPATTEELGDAVRIFGDVWYGGRTATAAHDQRMREIAERVAAAQPEAGGPEPVGAWVAPGAGGNPPDGGSP